MDYIPGSLEIRITRQPDGLVLKLRGELALASAPVLEQTLLDEEATGLARVVIDLSELDFLDSTGLHVLLNAQRSLGASGNDLILRRGPRAVHRVFELTGIDSRFRFEG